MNPKIPNKSPEFKLTRHTFDISKYQLLSCGKIQYLVD